MAESLSLLIADGVIDEVISRLKTGKEAEIFLVRHGEEILAAKVYKERHARNFKNNAAYKEGRSSRNSRTQRAMEKGSRFGQRAAEDAWKAKEHEALEKLHAVGVRVPRPVLMYEGVLLMEVIVDREGYPAPRLVDARIDQAAAADFYAQVRSQAIRMLLCDLIHGDLSPYNVLLAYDGPVIIDFPQVVGAAHNSQAASFFERDLGTIHRFFAGIDPALRSSANDGKEIWRAYQRRELTDDFVPTGKFQDERRGGVHPPHHKGGHGRAPRQDRHRAGKGRPRPGGASPVVSYVGRPPSSGGGGNPH